MNGSPATDALRRLPSVDRLLQTDIAGSWVDAYGRPAVVDALRAALDDARAAILAGDNQAGSEDALLNATQARLVAAFTPTLRPVINATGVIIHTNLGRAPLSRAALAAMQAAGGQYNTLEFDLETGKRGSRLIHADLLLRELTGAEGALVVNNNAAALVLLLSALAQGRSVILSRGHLVEIGGGFRVPEIMAQSGAHLIEVGTTNRTRAEDYRRAIDENTALLMHVHASNFKQIGFVEEASLEELSAIAHEHGIYHVHDLGSGALIDTSPYGLAHEPTVAESLAAGVDLIAFSGDKLLGGPQAGILLGRRAIIDRLKKHPLARALRVDKLTYSALLATLDHYRRGEALTEIPIWRMISRPIEAIEADARRWAAALGGEIVPGESTVGGGSLPGSILPTMLVALDRPDPDAIAAALRASDPPIIARIQDGRLLFDPRTVLPEQEETLLTRLRNI